MCRCNENLLERAARRFSKPSAASLLTWPGVFIFKVADHVPLERRVGIIPLLTFRGRLFPAAVLAIGVELIDEGGGREATTVTKRAHGDQQTGM